MQLINEELVTNEDKVLLLEQYKLYVEMTDRISQRRMNANTFFISVNTLLLTIVTILKSTLFLEWIFVGIWGGLLCLTWYLTLCNYRQLNSCKFTVILEIEKLLPISSFAYEWEFLRVKNEVKKYWPLSYIEKIVPILFCILYITLMIYNLLMQI